MKATLRKLFGTVMAVSLLASSVSMGNVEAKAPAKKGPEIRYCKETNIEFWKHINGRGG